MKSKNTYMKKNRVRVIIAIISLFMLPPAAFADTLNFTDPGNKTVNEGELLSFVLTATSNKSVTFSYSPLIIGASIGPVTKSGSTYTATFTWTPAPGQSGIYTVTYRACTPSCNASQSYTRTITVNPPATTTVAPTTTTTIEPAITTTTTEAVTTTVEPTTTALDTSTTTVEPTTTAMESTTTVEPTTTTIEPTTTTTSAASTTTSVACSGSEPSMATYTDYPIFQVNASVQPNILIMLDNSKSTNFAAYGTWNGAGQDITDPYEGGPSSKTIQVKIRQSADDAEESTTDGAVDLTGTVLDLIQNGSVNQVVGLRFQNVDIPPGATISSAVIRFKSAARKTSTASLVIYGENTDNASVFTSSAYSISNRPNTTASVNWNTIPSWSSGAFYETPELAPIVQELVNRSGWTANNALVFKFSGSGVRQALSYDGDQINPPMLIITYSFIPPTPLQYYGYFDPSARYTYSSNTFVRSASGEWSGNWLNWLCMRRIDVLRKVLMGGLATSRQGTGNQTNIGEAPDDRDCYYQKWFANNFSGATSVSPYNGLRCYGIKDGYLYVGEDSADANPYSGYAERYNIRVQKEEAYEPQDFGPDHNLAGVLQRVGDKARWGNLFFNYGTGSNESGGRVVSPIGTNMTSLITDLQNTHSNTLTPLAEAYYVAMQYFKQEPLASGLDYPNNALPNSGGDPWGNIECSKSFVILLNDGSPSVDRKIPNQYKNYSGESAETSFANDEVDIVRDGEVTATACETYGYSFPNCGSDYLKDLALYARTNDLRSDLSGSQNMILYVVHAFGGDEQGKQLLKDAARNGGFTDRNGNNKPDGTYTDPPEQRLEWDANGDGAPDTYYAATDGYQLERQLMLAINDILRRAASGTAVSVLATTGEGEGTLVQAYFRPAYIDGINEIKWTGYLQSLWVDTYGNLREDTDNDKSLNVNTDKILSFYLDSESGESKVKRYDVSSNPYPDISNATPEYLSLEEINPIWEAGKRLAYRDADTRSIYTFVDANSNGQVEPGEFIEFTTSNANTIKPLLGVACDSPWSYLGATYDDRVNNLINYIRGVSEDSSAYTGNPVMRSRTIGDKVWKLGDIVYSTPVSIARPVENYGLLYDDESYQTFYETYKNRETMVYVGANDGMLHAFTSGYYNPEQKKFEQVSGSSEQIGDELWAYIPQCLLPHLKWLPSESYTHVPYVDLKPKVVDVKIFTDDGKHPNGWGTLLLCGMNMGGKDITVPGVGTFKSSFAALDITDPRDPVLLWERNYPNLGLTINTPGVIKVHDQWFGTIGSGPTDYDGTSTQRGRVFIINLLTGELLKYFEGSENNAFMNSPVAVDKSLNYSADAIYVGESYLSGSWQGKAYKIAIPITNVPYIEGTEAVYETNPNNWQWTTLFSAPAPFTAPFSLSMDKYDNVWVFMGTGRYLSQADKSTSQQNYYYGVKDPFYDAYGPNKNTCYHQYVACPTSHADLFNADPYQIKPDGTVTVLAGGDSSITTFNELKLALKEKPGWRRSLVSGSPSERIINKPALFGGITLFPAFTPNADVCGYGGTSRLYAVYYETGTAYKKRVVGTPADNATVILDSISLGEGMSSTIGIHAGNEEGGSIYGQQSTGVIVEIEVQPAINPKSGTIYWSEGQ